MVLRTRTKSILNALALYVVAGALIGYFGMHAFSGDHGLKAKEDLTRQLGALSQELAELKTQRSYWERRVALLRADSIDPDLLEERARAMLDFVHPRDLVLLRPASPSSAGKVAAAQ